MKSSASPVPARRFGAIMDRAGMLLILGILIVACSVAVPNFATPQNAGGLLLQVSMVGIVATTMLFCLASGNFDLSVGTLIPCGAVLCALILRETNSVFLALVGALGFGALVGTVNGLVVAKLRINPLITTLSTMMMVKGIAFAFADGKSIGISNQAFLDFANFAFPKIYRGDSSLVLFQLTTKVWVCIALFLVFGFVLQRTAFGRNTLAIGGNEEAARLAGVAVTRIKITIFAVQGLVATLAGVLVAGEYGVGDPKTAPGSELSIIAACVLGGVSLSGGVGRMSYVVAGVLIMGVVENAMSLLAIESFYQYIVRGAVLLTAVIFDQLRQRKS